MVCAFDDMLLLAFDDMNDFWLYDMNISLVLRNLYDAKMLWVCWNLYQMKKEFYSLNVLGFMQFL